MHDPICVDPTNTRINDMALQYRGRAANFYYTTFIHTTNATPWDKIFKE
jgi:hypothetical protein